MKNQSNTTNLTSLYETILDLKNISEMRAFLRDLCTKQELQEMSERWAVAKALNKKQSYRAIAEKLNVSTTTVGRVATWLNEGEGGYRIALQNLTHHNSSPNSKKS
jgi:TrpR-related protein YerC/YecD